MDIVSKIQGPLFLTDRQLTMPKEMEHGFREISPHTNSRTGRLLNLAILGKWFTFLQRAILKDQWRRLEPREDTGTNN